GDAVRREVEVGARVGRSQHQRLGGVRDEPHRAPARVRRVRRGRMTLSSWFARAPRLAACAIAAATLAACGGGGDEGDAPDSFLAFSSTFASFRSWASFHSDGPRDDGTVPADVLGPRTQ